MSFIGSLFGKDAPDDRYIDDQAMQEDHRDDKFVGPAIDTACAVYDTMFDALKYAIRGKADVLGKMDKMVKKLEDRCKEISDKYQEILNQMNDVGADFAAGLNLDLMRTAFDLLDSNPILRRYVGEANYWVLWDTLATMSSQGASIGAGIMSNLKGAIKGTIYALISMTNGLMHFESYLTQLTQFWGWLYAKEIWLPLTDSICPQVTCAYYYKPEDDGQLEGSSKVGPGTPYNRLDKYNPTPGAVNFAPMPIPIFDYSKNPAGFIYDNPDTWDVLTKESQLAFQKAYMYWRSNYTNATSVNELLSAASSKLTGGKFTAGFGPRKHNHPLGTPLQVGKTFAQLYTGKNESFPVGLIEDTLADAYAELDDAAMAFKNGLGDAALCAKRDEAILKAFADPDAAPDWFGDGSNMIGQWWANADGMQGSTPESLATMACAEVAASSDGFKKYMAALEKLSAVYRTEIDETPDYIPNFMGARCEDSPLAAYLRKFYKALADESGLPALKDIIDKGDKNPEMYWPYGALVSDAGPHEYILYLCAMCAINAGNGFFYTESNSVMSAEIDVDAEVGRKIDGGRKTLFAAIGVYGNLLGLYPYDYKIARYDSFIEKYKRIKGSYRIYYNIDNPAEVIFADNIIRVGFLKYIVTCKACTTETISRGTGIAAESYTLHIFPGESCAVYAIPESTAVFGADFPSFNSLQRVDAESPLGAKYRFDLMTNAIPRWPKYVDPEKWSIMDLVHELWLLADALTPLCGDGGKRNAELNDLMNEFGLVADGTDGGPRFLGQLPDDDGDHIRVEFKAMNEFAGKLKKAINAVYDLRDQLIAATRNW